MCEGPPNASKKQFTAKGSWMNATNTVRAASCLTNGYCFKRSEMSFGTNEDRTERLARATCKADGSWETALRWAEQKSPKYLGRKHTTQAHSKHLVLPTKTS